MAGCNRHNPNIDRQEQEKAGVLDLSRDFGRRVKKATGSGRVGRIRLPAVTGHNNEYQCGKPSKQNNENHRQYERGRALSNRLVKLNELQP